MTEYLITFAVVLVHGLAILALLLSERRHPAATLAWMFAIIFLPFFGMGLYYAIGARRFRREAIRAAEATDRAKEAARHLASADRLPLEEPASQRTRALLRLGSRVADRPASSGNAVQLLVDGAATYEAMTSALNAASDHIHVLFYIIQPDETGTALRDLLVARAEEGIEVRILVDDVGSSKLPSDFFDPIRRAGGSAAVFKRVRWLYVRARWRDRFDFRNHRKIVVVDGRIGFTGGINIGREYLGLDPERGDWRDTHVQVEGPAVNALQRVFSSDWFQATRQTLSDDRYYPEFEKPLPGDCLTQVVGSGPDFDWSPISHIFTHCIALARERVWIANPYFVPGLPMRHALVTAALRGVDVRLLLPGRPDSLVVYWASRSYFKELLEAGARIFLYQRGFLHAKTMLADSWVATIGSANLDMRSFYLNFELNLFVYGRRTVEQLARQFEEDLGNASEITLEQERSMGFPRRLLCSSARLMSPLL